MPRLITASGLGDVEFARELFEELNALSAEDRVAWAQIFRNGRLPGVAAVAFIVLARWPARRIGWRDRDPEPAGHG